MVSILIGVWMKYVCIMHIRLSMSYYRDKQTRVNYQGWIHGQGAERKREREREKEETLDFQLKCSIMVKERLNVVVQPTISLQKYLTRRGFSHTRQKVPPTLATWTPLRTRCIRP